MDRMFRDGSGRLQLQGALPGGRKSDAVLRVQAEVLHHVVRVLQEYLPLPPCRRWGGRMRSAKEEQKEMRDAVLVFSAAFIYLSSAIIDPLLSLVILFLFLGTVVALFARERLNEQELESAVS